jgi:DNA-binding phage protein
VIRVILFRQIANTLTPQFSRILPVVKTLTMRYTVLNYQMEIFK